MGNDTKVMLFALGIATSIGPLTGLGLSFTALSPLVMGGIVASIVAALFTRRMIYSQNFSKESFVMGACLCSASLAIGVGLAAAATAVFPGVTLGMWSAALAGAIIAPISVIAGIIATFCIIEPIAKKVNEYIISPIVGKCFSSKEEEQAI